MFESSPALAISKARSRSEDQAGKEANAASISTRARIPHLDHKDLEEVTKICVRVAPLQNDAQVDIPYLRGGERARVRRRGVLAVERPRPDDRRLAGRRELLQPLQREKQPARPGGAQDLLHRHALPGPRALERG